MGKVKRSVLTQLVLMTGVLAVARAYHQQENADRFVRTEDLYAGNSNAKLRHSRHMTTRSSNSFYPEDVFLYRPGQIPSEPKLTVQDNHKPQFVNCSGYQPSVKEEEPVGTFVFRVEAVERDPFENGGKITYTFVSSPGERLRFTIEPDTGIIRTQHVFDRDEPTREKEVYLNVRATDNGHPQLDDVCLIKVTIEDINDNSPVFDKVNYLESVPQDLIVGHEVMRISATDIDDGNNSLVYYELEAKSPEDEGFFRIDNTSGIIFLNRNINRDPNYKFKMIARATDRGEKPLSVTIDLEILVVESHKKAPTFKDIRYRLIHLNENTTDFKTPVATITAQSNIPDENDLLFELVSGRTEQTNKFNTFVMAADVGEAQIKLGRYLDYESVSEYILTVRVQNKYNLAAETQITIHLEDVNDNIPAFTELVSGSVLEKEPAGTPVMQVRAIDADGTSAHNQVTYELADHQELFAIDPHTGNITTRVVFDREQKDFYNVKVIATDNSPSALYSSGDPNKGEQVFRIEIADKNDNPPRFTQKIYRATGIREDANIYSLVAEVKALDNDTSSSVTYHIVGGNTYDAFYIEENTGKIKIKNHLDYENVTRYNLSVRAYDGAFADNAYVEIEIENVNDNPPVFYDYLNNITIPEEQLIQGCITNVTAYDPDIPDRRAPQHILYFVVKEDQKKLLAIDKNGCLSLIKPLDRDPPNGFPIWQVIIAASDEDGNSKTSLRESTEVIIVLTDINDNAPFLDDKINPVFWRENQPPGTIASLAAKDLDSEENGAPFTYKIASGASSDIQKKFAISGSSLEALRTLDREEQKQYFIPIAIGDSGYPSMTGTSTLTLIVADENDNAMKYGESSIFIYNYNGEAPDTQIGRVYVEDPDDWDLPDKTFTWAESKHPNFSLDQNTGMITMNHGTNNASFLLNFIVTEESRFVSRHSVEAIVNVTVKEIPEEAVDRSGSIRFAGTSDEEFVTVKGGVSKRDLLRNHLAKVLNVSLDNVDVFTVLHSHHNADRSLLDVRYSAHGSPYYHPERLNYMISLSQEQLEKELGLEIVMINIDECLVEKASCETSCVNFLNKSKIPHAVFTNTSSFVGVGAVVDPYCTCNVRERLVCLNGGTPLKERCVCPDGYDGPRCELLGIGFVGEGWALYPPLHACEESRLSFDLRPDKGDGLVFYIGPTRKKNYMGVQDFMALELSGGYPRLLVDYGSGTVRVNHSEIRLTDGNFHHIDITWNNMSIELEVDNCRKSSCLSLTAPNGKNEYLNVNGPLQIGGAAIDLQSVADSMGWAYKPTTIKFEGCISNWTFNGKTYDLGKPHLAQNVDVSCNSVTARAYSFGIDTNFIVAILVCIVLMIALMLAVVIHKRKSDDLYKDADDIRENIINYEDEGGGEGDMTCYDLNVLRLMYNGEGIPLTEKSPMKDSVQGRGPDDVPDICGFLDGKKKAVDNDPETNPFDDVRHYAYEGDGNSMGSLSSLASGTDEEDLDFDYLSNFGPRFRKLADMYGEQPSDNESDRYTGPASESWC